MIINSIDNKTSFQSIKLQHISRKSPAGRLLMTASKDPLLKGQINALEKQGLFIKLIRRFDNMGQKTDFVNFNLSLRHNNFSKENMATVRGIPKEIKTLNDAKILLAEAITKSIDFVGQRLISATKSQNDKSKILHTINSQAKPVGSKKITYISSPNILPFRSK